MSSRVMRIVLNGGFLFLFLAGTLAAQDSGDGREAFAPAQPEAFTVSAQQDFLLFTWQDGRVAATGLVVRDVAGHLVSDSGEAVGPAAVWDIRLMSMNRELVFELRGWDGEGNLVQQRGGVIRRGETTAEPFLVRAYDVTGNFTISGNLGVGTETPERAIHIRGNNAVFRMDRSQNTAAFMLVRTDPSGSPLKTYVAGVDADGANQGQFVINDLGTAVTGGGTRRMTIANGGEVTFTGNVRAAGFVNTTGGANSVLTSVSHDSSLSGSGTPASPLGIAANAPFPRPAYDSGWRTIGACESQELPVDFSDPQYTVDNMVVDMQTNQGSGGASNQGVGGFGEKNGYPSHGIRYFIEADKTIWIWRFCDDTNVFSYRVRVWFYR